MVAHRTEAIVSQDGSIVVSGLPFRAGEKVEVLCIETSPVLQGDRFPLRGRQPYRFDDPFSPAIAPEEWESLR